MRQTFLGVLFICLGLAGCARPGDDTSPIDLKARIDANNAAWSVAANRGDAAAIAALYTEDAIMLPSGADIRHGRAAIEKTLTGLVNSGVRNFTLAAEDVAPIGPDTAREIGRFSLDAMGPKKKWVKVDGKYVVIWKRVAGKWMLDVDIWNLNK